MDKHPLVRPLESVPVPVTQNGFVTRKAIGLTVVLVLLSAVSVIFIASRGRDSKNTMSMREKATLQGSTSPPGITSSQPTPVPSAAPNRELPQAHVIPGGRHVFQSFNNCGPASLSIALSLLGTTRTQQELGQRTRPHQNAGGDNDDKSVTLEELAAQAEKEGYKAYFRPAGNIELLQRAIAYNLPVITRTWLKPNEDIGHFRVVKGYDMKTRELIQDDSLQGKDLRYSFEDFNSLWLPFNAEFLVLFPTEKQHLVGEILRELEDEHKAWEKALSISEQTLRNNPSDIWAEFNLSVALFHLGRGDESISAFENVEPRLPSRMLWYQVEPLRAYVQAGQYEKAESRIAKILSNHNRAYSELYFLRSVIAQNKGDTTAGEENLSLAQQYNSSDSWRVNVE